MGIRQDMIKRQIFYYTLIIGFLIISVVLWPNSAFTANAKDRIGIILLHGKTGTPEIFIRSNVIDRLKHEGFMVDAPEMPWSHNRYIDKSYDEALNEIDLAVESLKKKGANRIIMAGHSMGANAALAYAAYHGGISGIILLAPGHAPDSIQGRGKFVYDVEKAKSMTDTNQGNKVQTFNDSNTGRNYTVRMKSSIYYSYFNPDGIAAMSRSAGRISPAIPVLYIAGTQDKLTVIFGKQYIFDKLPKNPLTKYAEVDADHLGTPAAAIDEMVFWLNSLRNFWFYQHRHDMLQ